MSWPNDENYDILFKALSVILHKVLFTYWLKGQAQSDPVWVGCQHFRDHYLQVAIFQDF